MKQSLFTDYSLRPLMHLAAEPQRRADGGDPPTHRVRPPPVLSQRLSIGPMARTAP